MSKLLAYKHIHLVVNKPHCNFCNSCRKFLIFNSIHHIHVKPDNIAELISQPDVDGALVGGASLKADSFAAIVTNCLKYTVK